MELYKLLEAAMTANRHIDTRSGRLLVVLVTFQQFELVECHFVAYANQYFSVHVPARPNNGVRAVYHLLFNGLF
jgi:hypothetical protein